jgi:flagellar biosynthesis protein FlhG
MNDALQARAPASVLVPGGRIIAIASGKGGVGKTWLAISLSHALARAGQRVLLFDGDLGLANVDIQLGLRPGPDLGAVVSGRLSLEEAVLKHEGGFDILAGHSGSGALSSIDPAALERLLTGLRTAARGYTTVLLDLGAGLDRPVRRMASFADLLLVIATDEPTSLTDAYAVLKLHGGDSTTADRESQVVVNIAASKTTGARTYATLARACTSFLGRTPPMAGIIRRDDHVRDSIRRQSLLLSRYPTCAAALDVEALAARLNEVVPEARVEAQN